MLHVHLIVCSKQNVYGALSFTNKRKASITNVVGFLIEKLSSNKKNYLIEYEWDEPVKRLHQYHRTYVCRYINQDK